MTRHGNVLRRAIAIGGLATLALGAAAVAQAEEPSPGGISLSVYDSTLIYEAAPDTANILALRQDVVTLDDGSQSTRFTIDDSQPIYASEGVCKHPDLADQTRVVCLIGEVVGGFTIETVMGAGDDVVDVVLEDPRANAIINGDAGADRLVGRTDHFVLYGGAGNDVLRGGVFCGGGDGADVATGCIRSEGGAGNDKLTGTNGRDVMIGGQGNDVIRGGRGNDVIYGNTGADLIYGNSGNDRIRGGPGRDRIYGGPGTDTITQ